MQFALAGSRYHLVAGAAAHNLRTMHRTHAGVWQGTVVALKVLVLPPQLSRDEKRRQMALMEAAISSAMSHPHIVQVRRAGWVAGLQHAAQSNWWKYVQPGATVRTRGWGCINR